MVADFTIDWLFNLLYTPTAWNQSVNTYVYEFVAVVLQSAQAHNVTVPGGDKYNVPSENIADPTPPTVLRSGPVLNLTDYSTAAIIGTDGFRDNQTTIKDIFGVIVQITREVTPTCTFAIVGSFPFDSLTPFPDQVGAIWSILYVQEELFSEGTILTIFSSVMMRMDSPPVPLNSSPHTTLGSSRIQLF